MTNSDFFLTQIILKQVNCGKKAQKLVDFYIDDLKVEFVEKLVQFKTHTSNFSIETKNMQRILKLH